MPVKDSPIYISSYPYCGLFCQKERFYKPIYLVPLVTVYFIVTESTLCQKQYFWPQLLQKGLIQELYTTSRGRSWSKCFAFYKF
uniref:Uncharacterized protein n=1 Tax=Anguilla anguilla TaxID=7936 RepID=A0A0E9QHY8_ANGAN